MRPISYNLNLDSITFTHLFNYLLILTPHILLYIKNKQKYVHTLYTLLYFLSIPLSIQRLSLFLLLSTSLFTLFFLFFCPRRQYILGHQAHFCFWKKTSSPLLSHFLVYFFRLKSLLLLSALYLYLNVV